MRNLLVSWRGCAAFLVVCLYVSACADTEQNPNSGNTFTDVLTTTGSTSDDEHGGTADGNGTEGDDTGAETGFYAEDLVTEPTIQAPAVPPAPAPAEAEPAQPG